MTGQVVRRHAGTGQASATIAADPPGGDAPGEIAPDGVGPDGAAPGGTAAAILAAARAEIGDTGAFSLKGTAARAGVSRQAIHYHFGGARGLRAALRDDETVRRDGTALRDDEIPTRDRLLAAAERLLAQPGGGIVTVEAIAAEASLTKGAVYHHFADRAELLAAVARRMSPVGELAEALRASADLPVRDALAGLARAYYAAMHARADIVRHLAANAGRDTQLGEILMGEVIGRGAPIIVGWIQGRIAAGELRDVNPSLIIQALFGPAFLRIVLGGAVFDRLESLGVQPAATNPTAYVDLLLGGIAGRATNPVADRGASGHADPEAQPSPRHRTHESHGG